VRACVRACVRAYMRYKCMFIYASIEPCRYTCISNYTWTRNTRMFVYVHVMIFYQ